MASGNDNTSINISPNQSNIANIENKTSSYEMPKGEYENILKTLEKQNSFRQSNVMCDVTLIASDGVKILAHKVILASSSDFFLSKFNNSDFKEKNKQSVQIKEIDSITLETIINYIYTFKLDITEHTIMDILKASQFLQLNRLKEKCCEYTEYNLNLTNCISIMKFAKLISYDRLYDISFTYVKENFFNIDVSISYELSYEEVKNIISDDCLITESEEQVFIFILNWTKCDENNRKKYLPELIKCIRLSFISKSFLLNVLKEELLLRDCTIMEYLLNFLLEPNSKYDMRNPKLINKVLVSINTDTLNPTKIDYSYISSELLEWKCGPDFFRPLGYGSKIVAIDNKYLFSIGGKTCENKVTDDVYILDLSTRSKEWMKTTSMISSRCEHAVCTHNNRIFAIGGIDAQNRTLNTIEVFDVNTKIWNIYCTMSNSRRYCSAIFHKKYLYIIGGRNEKYEVLSTVECYDDISNTWDNYIDSLPQPIWATCITIYKYNLYVIGGLKTCNISQKECSNTIYKFTLSRDSVWCPLPSLIKSRFLASCEVLDEKLYIFGGKIDILSYAQSIEILDLKNNSISTQNITLKHFCQNMLKLNSIILN